MIIKLILGQYSYLYHGKENFDELKDYINSLTNMEYIIKWKDFDDDMITIKRQIDLQNCYQACKTKKKDTFKLYIIETFEKEVKQNVNREETPNLTKQDEMKQDNYEQQQKTTQQVQPVEFQSEILFEQKNKKTLEQQQLEFRKAKSTPNPNIVEPTKQEKEIFLKKCISLAFEEFYPGLNQYLEQNQNIKVQQ